MKEQKIEDRLNRLEKEVFGFAESNPNQESFTHEEVKHIKQEVKELVEKHMKNWNPPLTAEQLFTRYGGKTTSESKPDQYLTDRELWLMEKAYNAAVNADEYAFMGWVDEIIIQPRGVPSKHRSRLLAEAAPEAAK